MLTSRSGNAWMLAHALMDGVPLHRLPDLVILDGLDEMDQGIRLLERKHPSLSYTTFALRRRWEEVSREAERRGLASANAPLLERMP